jgi:hypothetical protein
MPPLSSDSGASGSQWGHVCDPIALKVNLQWCYKNASSDVVQAMQTAAANNDQVLMQKAYNSCTIKHDYAAFEIGQACYEQDPKIILENGEAVVAGH